MQNRVGDDLAKACVEGYKKGLEEGYKKGLEEDYQKVLEEQVPVDLGAQGGRAFKRINKESWEK